MSNVRTNIGLTVEVSTAIPTSLDVSATTGFPSLTYSEVTDVVSVGGLGFSFSAVTQTLLKSGVTQTGKGALSYEPFSINLPSSAASAGRTILEAKAVHVTEQVSIKLTDVSNKVIYLSGIVLSDKTNASTADAVQETVFEIPINEAPVYA